MSDKPKRGRRTKNEMIKQNLINLVVEVTNVTNAATNEVTNATNEVTNATNDVTNDVTNEVSTEPEPHVSKKRGRKPKGGKIIQQNILNDSHKEIKSNIILHLKCSLKDIELDYNKDIESFNFNSSKNELTYQIINPIMADINQNKICPFNEYSQPQSHTQHQLEKTDLKDKEIWRKLKNLEHNLHINNLSDKKSACFWCSYDFDSNPIYIPKHVVKESYNVYGCFCSPECATAYLMEENLDSSTKFERYYLLNHLYTKIYNYTKSIKPAPNPHYMLDKFYGNLTIQEYRALLKSERLFLIVDKPLTRILPEFHEDNDEFIINNKIIPINNNIKKTKPLTKNNIVSEHFGLNA